MYMICGHKFRKILTSNKIEIQFSYFNICFRGIYKDKLKFRFNFIVFLVNYFIFLQNKISKHQNINGFMQLLQQTREIEECIAFS